MPDEGSYLDISLRKIAKGAGIGFTGTFIGMALGYLSRMVIARFLGASDYGLVCLGFAAMSIATALSMVGLDTGIQRYVSFYKGKGDKERIKGTILSAIKISFPLSIISALVLFLGARWISIYIFHTPELTLILKIFSIGIPFWILTRIFLAGTIGFQDLRYRVYVNDIFQNTFKIVAIVIFLALGFGVFGAALGWVLAIVLMPFLAFYFLEKKVFPILNTKVKAVPVEKELFFFSFPLIFASLAGLIMSWTDTLMLGYFCTPSEVGIYNAALPTARLLSMGAGAFGVIFMPVASELYARGRIEDLRNIYSAVTKWIMSTVLPLFLLMCLFSGAVMRILFGYEYITGASALSILALGYFISSLFGLSVPVLQSYGKTKIIMISNFLGAGANVALNYLLIPLYGVNGAAIATALTITFMNLLYFLSAYRITRMQPLKKSIFKTITASIASILIVYPITRFIIGASMLSLSIMFIVFLALYFFFLLIFKSFEEEDLVIMRAIDQRLGTKTDWVRRIIQKFL